MLNHKFISVDYIINRIKAHPLMIEYNPEDIIEKTIQVLKLVECPLITVEHTCIKDLVNGMAKIPLESESIKDVYYTSAKCESNLIGSNYITKDNFFESGYKFTRMLGNTDALSSTRHTQSLNNFPSFIINYNTIVTNKKVGSVLIVYNKLATDINGVPLILDNQSLLLAIENYIKKEYFKVLLDLGRLPNRMSLDSAESDYCWYIGQAQSYFAGLNTDGEIEAFLNYFRKMYQEDSNFHSRNSYDNLKQYSKPL